MGGYLGSHLGASPLNSLNLNVEPYFYPLLSDIESNIIVVTVAIENILNFCWARYFYCGHFTGCSSILHV
jgi:hypothetical protein